jgi:hypothetical protein
MLGMPGSHDPVRLVDVVFFFSRAITIYYFKNIYHKCPLSLEGPESNTEWVVGKGITIYFVLADPSFSGLSA